MNMQRIIEAIEIEFCGLICGLSGFSVVMPAHEDGATGIQVSRNTILRSECPRSLWQAVRSAFRKQYHDAQRLESEYEDGTRCRDCGSTEAGSCFYCKMD